MFPEDVALKRVNEFMPENVIGFTEARGKRQDHASGEVIRETTHTFRNGARKDRRLGEV
jgi:hypothetical protein